MQKLSPWISWQGSALRVIEGSDSSELKNRIAFVEKTPRVRIRADYMGVSVSHRDSAGFPIKQERQWAEFLDWCEGPSGSGPEDKESLAWCDRMLVALGYKL